MAAQKRKIDYEPQFEAGLAIPASGNRLTSAQIKTEGIETASYQKESITNPKLAVGCVESGNIVNESVIAEKLGSESVTQQKIKAGAVIEVKLGNESVSSAKIKKEAVIPEKLGAESVENTKIKAKAVTGGKIAEETIETTNIKKEAITGAKLATGSVTESKLGEEAVGTLQLATEAVTALKTRKASLPAKAAEGAVTVGAVVGIARKLVVTLTGKTGVSAFVINHKLSTYNISATVATSSSEHQSEIPVTALAKIVALNENEVELTFTVAPSAGVQYWVTIIG